MGGPIKGGLTVSIGPPIREGIEHFWVQKEGKRYRRISGLMPGLKGVRATRQGSRRAFNLLQRCIRISLMSQPVESQP